MKKIKVIYFIDGAKPTEEDKEAIASIDGKVITRNARFVCDDELEHCDAVAGRVPPHYAAAFPPLSLNGETV